MGVVEHYPRDLSVLYAGDYYDAGAGAPSGYSSYEATAAHGTSWAAQLVRVLRPAGASVLDVGCADGYLLAQLGPAFQLTGIEVNAEMVAKCRARGIDIIGSDLLDSDLARRHAGHFDVVTAIAVLEHLPDLRIGLSRIRQLLKPDGIALIELPLLTDGPSDENWFSSSLEHVFYPTDSAIRRVCSLVFGTETIGGEARVEGYASNWVGLLTSNPDATGPLKEMHRRLFDGPISNLSVEEKIFRFLFEVIHLARPSRESVGLLAGIGPHWLRPELLERIGSLWGDAIAKAQNYSSLEQARDFHASQAQKRERHVEELKTLISTLEEARDFNALQAKNWQQAFEKQKMMTTAVEEARDFHALQARNWRRNYELASGKPSEKEDGS